MIIVIKVDVLPKKNLVQIRKGYEREDTVENLIHHKHGLSYISIRSSRLFKCRLNARSNSGCKCSGYYPDT